MNTQDVEALPDAIREALKKLDRRREAIEKLAEPCRVAMEARKRFSIVKDVELWTRYISAVALICLVESRQELDGLLNFLREHGFRSNHPPYVNGKRLVYPLGKMFLVVHRKWPLSWDGEDAR